MSSGPSIRRSIPRAVILGIAVLAAMLAACIGSLPWTLAPDSSGVPSYNAGQVALGRLPPSWCLFTPDQSSRFAAVPGAERFTLGSDQLGRSLLQRCLVGGAISLTVGVSAAALSVLIGTLYGAAAGYIGGRTDALLMRIVDVLYGLPYVLLVVLFAVATDAVVGEYVTRNHARHAWVQAHTALTPDHAELEHLALQAIPPRELSPAARTACELSVLLISIGGVSWLTMARVIRGQVLSLKARPFVEAARAVGASPFRIFRVHLLPNLVGPIVVYATLTVPQAILQESFLSFLGIGVKPPLPSWGNLAADGLAELNTYQSNWWLLLFPCLLVATALLALNFAGEGLREWLDPKSPVRGGRM